MRFPLIKLTTRHAIFPKDRKCPICQKPLDGDFIILEGGALTVEGKNSAAMFKKGEAECFLGFSAHLDSTETFTGVDIVERNRDTGQFEIYCCSVACMRKLFGKALDQLDTKIQAKTI